jgi:endonuclease III related protein
MSLPDKNNPAKNKKSAILYTYNLLYKAYGAQYWWPARSPFEVAVGAILTQNTNWSNVEKAILNLKKEKLLNSNGLHNANTRCIADAIKSSGYYNIKAQRLKCFVDFLHEKYKGNISLMKTKRRDMLRRELLDINGIGPETADSILLYALKKPVFIVDAYTRRIAECLGLAVRGDDYSDIQDVFMNNLPESVEIFNEYHALIVRHAKDVCRKKPVCASCVLRSLKRSSKWQ